MGPALRQSGSDDLRAIVHPGAALEHFSLTRWDPAPPLDRFADRFWKTEWDLDEPFVQTIVTYPVVNLVFQADGSAIVSGVQRHNDERRLSGAGWALGVMFRPGGFRPLSGGPLAALTDRRVSASEIFGPRADDLASAVTSTSDDERRIELISDFLTTRLPEQATVGEELSDLVETSATADPPVTQVAELARRFGASVRTLQRLFGEHVGVGPKLVLDRYRIQAAAEAARHPIESWSDVAQRIGYADQAHLTADFSATIGSPPGAYAKRESAEDHPR